MITFDIDAWLVEAAKLAPPPAPITAANPPGDPLHRANRTNGQPESDRDRRIARALAYVERRDPAIQGNHGSDDAFDTACVLIKGFGLSIDDARPIFQGYSDRCVPPWNEREIEHKLAQADAKPDDKPRGYLYNAPNPNAAQHVVGDGRYALEAGRNGVAPSTNGAAGLKPPGNPVANGQAPAGDRPTFEFSDMGNAHRLLHIHGSKIRYCKPYGDWLVFDGSRWIPDERLVIESFAQDIPGQVLAEMPPTNNDQTIAAFRKWSLASQSKDKLAAAISAARNHVSVIPNELDQDPWLLNVRNGTINLRTGDFRPHRSSDLITKVAPVAYDPAAKCPAWDKFILEIMKDDPDLVDYLQRALGYAISGVIVQHVFFCCYGTGANGKALAIDTPIATPTGWTTMGELSVGDTVFDDYGNPCRVTFVTDVMHDHRCYEVAFNDGSAIVADAEHIWETEMLVGKARPQRKSGLRTTEEIASTLIHRTKDNGQISYAHRVRLAGPLMTESVDLLIDPYVLGAWLGDGHSASARLTCSTTDIQIVEEIRSAGVEARQMANPNRTPIYRFGDGKITGRYGKTSWTSKLKILGVLNNKHIPAQYLRAGLGQRLALIQGLMDTDGTISRVGQCEFAVTNERLARDFHELACSLGLKPTFRAVPAMLNGRQCGMNYRVQFRACTNVPVFRLKRKLERQAAVPTKPTLANYRSINKITPVDSVPVRCIQVDSPSHLYLAGRSMIPTHNTTAFKCLHAILGDYANEIDSDILLSQSSAQHPTGLTELEGRRLVISEETDDTRRLAEALVKKLTGGSSTISARKMHKDFYKFRATHHLFLATNHKPEIRGTDPAIWRRIKLLPFEVSFDPTVPGGRTPDLHLDEKLAREHSGILNWLIAGCRAWQDRGLIEPPAILAATRGYREEMDTLGWFLEERCVAEEGSRVILSVVYGEYIAWCGTTNITPVGIRKFSSQLTDRGHETKKSHSTVFKMGVRLKLDHERSYDMRYEESSIGQDGGVEWEQAKAF